MSSAIISFWEQMLDSLRLKVCNLLCVQLRTRQRNPKVSTTQPAASARSFGWWPSCNVLPAVTAWPLGSRKAKRTREQTHMRMQLPTGTNLCEAPARGRASGTDDSDSGWCVRSSVGLVRKLSNGRGALEGFDRTMQHTFLARKERLQSLKLPTSAPVNRTFLS